MTRVIHTGDTHVGYRQYNSPERREDFLRAFQRVIADAIDDDVDAVVHAGDLFHDRRPGLRDLQGTVAALRDLAAADVPFLAVVGNHESKRDGQWLDLFEDLGLATRLGSEPTVVGDTAFYGLDFVPESRREDLTYDFAPHDADHAALVSHGLFEPFAHADWDTEAVLSAATVDFDAVLLGDNHAPGKREVLDTWVTYCGSTERASAAERDDRGYNIVTFDGDVRISRRAVPDTRPFRFVDVELGEGEGVERVREQVRQHDLDDAVVVVSVDGDGEPFAPAAVEETATEAGALLARVTDRREVEEESEVSVSFADPDDAVRERVAEMGLSSAARDVDETVRASKVADSNVREEVKRRVQDLVDEDPGAFDPAEGGERGTDADGVSGATDDAEAEAAGESSDSTGSTDDGEPSPADSGSDGQPSDAVGGDGETLDDAPGDDGETPEGATGEAEEGDTDGTATAAEDGGDPAADGQASMEEYL